MQSAAKKAQDEYMAALANDLNTAEARAPIFDLVRTANTAIDQGQVLCGRSRRSSCRARRFDAVFDVIEDHDAEPTRERASLGQRNGRNADVAPDLLAQQSLSDEMIDALVAERDAGQKTSQFCSRRPDSQ